MINELAIAWVIGLSSSAHCIAMCGGIASSITSNLSGYSHRKAMMYLLIFHIGKAICYTLIGLIAGTMFSFTQMISGPTIAIARLLSALLLIAIACYVLGWFNMLSIIEKRMLWLWRIVQPRASKLLHQANPLSFLLLGLCWGLLPCGVVYSTALWAAGLGYGPHTAWLMFAFGLGVMPSLLAITMPQWVLAKRLQSVTFKRLMGVILLCFGLWALVMPVNMLLKQTDGEHHMHHDHGGQCH